MDEQEITTLNDMNYTRSKDRWVVHTEFKKDKDITLKEFLGDFYDDLIVLTNNDKQRILNILEHYADKSGFFERIREHIEYLESENERRVL